MLKIYLALVLLAVSTFAESVRETETWMPLKASEEMNVDLVSSGDFAFPIEDSETFDDDDDDDYEDDDNEDDELDHNEDYMSGSGDDSEITEPEDFNNHIPDTQPKAYPTAHPVHNDDMAVKNNEVGLHPSVLLSQAGEQNIFNKKEVLAAVIAGGAIGLLFAVLLVLLLVYRMKKKDEGSYDLGKKPIYKKAPTAEIYA